MNTPSLRHLSPGSQEPGLFLSPKPFISRLLSPAELDRVRCLLRGPQHTVEADKRLMNLGLARVALGKTVATLVARESIWRERYELRRGSHTRQISADCPRDALAQAWSLARRQVGPHWQERLVQEGGDGLWRIFLPPPRWQVRPYELELRKLP
jgi:hypothetical protein